MQKVLKVCLSLPSSVIMTLKKTRSKTYKYMKRHIYMKKHLCIIFCMVFNILELELSRQMTIWTIFLVLVSTFSSLELCFPPYFNFESSYIYLPIWRIVDNLFKRPLLKELSSMNNLQKMHNIWKYEKCNINFIHLAL
jgi:hypothetical protein